MDRGFYSEYDEIDGRHWWFAGRQAILLSVLAGALGEGRDRTLLDFGCGTGGMAAALQRFGAVHGVDRDPNAVAFCQERGLTDVRLLEDDRLPFDDERFDVVTAFDVLEHIDDDLAAMVELRRVLRPGGTFLAAVPAFPFLWGAQDEISHHFRRYVRPQLVARLEDAGFAVERATYFNSLLFPPIAAIRVLRRAAPGREQSELRSDFGTGPAMLNGLLARLFASEAALLRRTDLPVGVSLLALCRRAS